MKGLDLSNQDFHAIGSCCSRVHICRCRRFWHHWRSLVALRTIHVEAWCCNLLQQLNTCLCNHAPETNYGNSMWSRSVSTPLEVLQPKLFFLHLLSINSIITQTCVNYFIVLNTNSITFTLKHIKSGYTFIIG